MGPPGWGWGAGGAWGGGQKERGRQENTSIREERSSSLPTSAPDHEDGRRGSGTDAAYHLLRMLCIHLRPRPLPPPRPLRCAAGQPWQLACRGAAYPPSLPLASSWEVLTRGAPTRVATWGTRSEMPRRPARAGTIESPNCQSTNIKTIKRIWWRRGGDRGLNIRNAGGGSGRLMMMTWRAIILDSSP